MTAPTEPSVEASEAHVVTVRDGIHHCARCGESGLSAPVLPCRGTDLSAALIARWPVFPMEIFVAGDGHNSLRPVSAVEVADWFAADHERAVRQARAEGAAEALREACEALADCPEEGEAKRGVEVARIVLRMMAELRDSLARAAQPEDARGGEAGE